SGTNCATDPATNGRVQTARNKLLTNVAKACGGADKTCGTADDDSLASIGWGAITTCPNFQNGACTNAINHCGDVATCLACFDDAVVAQANTLSYAALVASQFGTHS